jgi:diguanylate cyclase (GGDEF)-like protein
VLSVVRKTLLPLVSVCLVVGLGVLAAWGHLTTARHVDAAQRADRLRLEQTLSGLTSQYLQFAFLDSSRAAASERWELRPRSAADRVGLRRVVTGSHLAGYGATLTDLTGRPLTSWAQGPLPAPTDPGFAPLRASLLAGKPGLSSVLQSAGRPLVAFAVPVVQGGVPAGLLLAYADARTWPLQDYDSTILLGDGAATYVLDPHRVVAASSTQSAVGRPLEGLPAVATAGGNGVADVHRAGVTQVVSYSPVGGGWTTVTVQGKDAFSAGVRSRSQRDAVVLVVLLTVVVVALAGLNHLRQQALRRLAEERLHDPLTGLGQRGLFTFRLEAALARQRRSRRPLAVVYADLDAFKEVNDTLGHNVGDQLLVAVGQRLRSVTRDDDFVARLGGDEFAVVLEGVEVGEVAEVVERLQEAVQQPLALGGTVLHPRISVGAALLRDPERADDLLREADMAMYQVKKGAAPGAVVVLEALGSTSRDERQPLSLPR